MRDTARLAIRFSARFTARLLAASLLAVVATSAVAADDPAAAWQATQRAQSAHQALSDRYLAIWPTLDAQQKARFAADERAWLNEGRQQEQRACMARAGTSGELVAARCDADVLERHLRALAVPQRVAVSR